MRAYLPLTLEMVRMTAVADQNIFVCPPCLIPSNLATAAAVAAVANVQTLKGPLSN